MLPVEDDWVVVAFAVVVAVAVTVVVVVSLGGLVWFLLMEFSVVTSSD